MGTFIVDIDGTLAERDLSDPHVRGPFDWDRVGEDLPKRDVISIVQTLYDFGHQIIFMSGRSDVCRYLTHIWLLFHVSVPGVLLMRPEGDHRPDTIVKRELYEMHVAPYGPVTAVLDDRNSVVKMWREELGLTCLQVAEGDF